MSELEAVHAFDVYEAYTKTGDDDAAQVYLKDEADKVIAELKAYNPIQPIGLLKPRIMENGCEYYLAGEVRMCIEQAARQIVESNSVYKELDTIIKHQKYKRCLAMAKWCDAMKSYFNESGFFDVYANERMVFYERWLNRWLKIAEQFKDKEAK